MNKTFMDVCDIESLRTVKCFSIISVGHMKNNVKRVADSYLAC
jgi:hypothetical protein